MQVFAATGVIHIVSSVLVEMFPCFNAGANSGVRQLVYAPQWRNISTGWWEGIEIE